jgi:hydroxypyruvate isomerase
MESVAEAYDFDHEQQRLQKGTANPSKLLAPLRGNMDLLGLVHIAYVPGRHAPGTGIMDYAAIYRELRKQGYRGWVAMEFLPIGDAAQNSAGQRRRYLSLPNRPWVVTSQEA